MRRRRLLAGAGGGLVVLVTGGCSGLPVIPRRPAPDLGAAIGWIRHAGGRFTLVLPRAELGQGIDAALVAVACAELGVAPDRLDLRLHASDDLAPVKATVGSDSVRDFVLPLAQACATLREALAAGRTEGLLRAEPHPPAALRSLRPGVLPSSPLPQGQAIVRGAPLFAADGWRPGQLHGRVLRAPATTELRSVLAGLDEAAARRQPGFLALVHDERLRMAGADGLGIVAMTPGALDRIEAALQLRWRIDGDATTDGIERAIDIDVRLAHGPLAHALVRDRIDRTEPWHVDLRLDVPLAAHAAIEPRAAVAEWDANGQGLQLWTGSQDVFYVRDLLARRLGLDADRVRVQGCRVGGGFGGRTLPTVELEAALLARAVGRPVKVQWTRAQELSLPFHRPPSSHRIRARLLDDRLHTWWHAFASSHILFTAAALPAWMQRLTDVIGDDGVARGAALPYRCAARRVEFDLVRLPVHTGPWRGLGAGPNGLAMESAIDECARAARQDPLAFRLAHAGDPRLARVLRAAAAAAAAWPAPPADGMLRRGRGLASGLYKATSYAAVMAEVVVAADGTPAVTRLLCAHDGGRIIDADRVRAQCEGNLVWGLGMVLTDGLDLADGRITAANFDRAPIPRLAQIPPLQVVLVDEGEPSSGAGETAIVAAAAAIANALRSATGVRPTRFPVQAADLRASTP